MFCVSFFTFLRFLEVENSFNSGTATETVFLDSILCDASSYPTLMDVIIEQRKPEEKMVFQRDVEGKEQASVEVVSTGGSGERRQRLAVVLKGDEPVVTLCEGGARLRSWPLHVAKLSADQPGGIITIEAGGETLSWTCSDEFSRRELARAAAAAIAAERQPALDAEALGALLEDAGPDDADAEQWVKRLAERLARLDALNVGGMLAAATEGGGAKLATRLEAGVTAGSALVARLGRYEAVTRGAGAPTARGGEADAGARALLRELEEVFQWLDAPALADLESLPQVSLSSAEGRARLLVGCEAVRSALRRARSEPAARLRLSAVQERLRRLKRAKEQLAGAVARHLNNTLIHLGNEAATATAAATATGAGAGAGAATSTASSAGACWDPQRHQQELLPYAPFLRWLKDMDEKAFAALMKVYVGAWSRVYEREVRSACDAAKAALAGAPPEKADELLDQVLTLVENLCNVEQDFCTQFFCLDIDVKSDCSDGERSEKSETGDTGSSSAAGASVSLNASTGAGGRKAGTDSRRFMMELFPAVDAELVALVGHIERHDTYGAMRALACAGRRVLSPGEGGSEGRWALSLLAGVAVAAKRQADRLVADRIAAQADAVKQASRKPKCGVLSFIGEFEALSAACERIFSAGTRRADLERWYLSLATAMLATIQNADHPRTPKALIHTENYHRLHGVLSTLRVSTLETARRECKTRYQDALRLYVTQYFGRPLDKLTVFFEGVAEAVAQGAREEEVCYRAAFSKHELRRLLAMYPAHEVRKSLHRLYRTVEKHVSEESGLLQVVWRAMQEEFLAQYVALQARIAACYPGAGLAMPLSTQDILDAFSDIAREH